MNSLPVGVSRSSHFAATGQYISSPESFVVKERRDHTHCPEMTRILDFYTRKCSLLPIQNNTMVQASATETALVSRQRQTMTPAERCLILGLALNYARRWETQRQQSDMTKRKANSRSGREFWVPRVDIFDDPDSQYIVGVFEVPGVGREDASINVVGGKLIIEGKRGMKFKRCSQTSGGWDTEEEGSSDCTSRVQRSLAELRYGKFRRELVLPAGVDSTHVRVLLEHGMLHVQWPRSVPKTGVKRRATDDSCSSSKRQRKSTDTV